MLQINVMQELTIDDKLNLIQQGANVDVNQIDKEQQIKNKIDSGQITASNFASLTPDEQETVKLVLFKNYSPTPTDIPKSLSAAEFMFVSIIKIMGKAIDRTKLSTQESAFLDSLVQTISQNDMPIDNTTDWRFIYLNDQFTAVQNNRAAYLQKKMNVTGTM